MELREIAFLSGLSRDRAAAAPPAPRARLLEKAEGLLQGRWDVFEIARADVTADADWHVDARHDVHVTRDVYAFDLGMREAGFDPKYVWELSRHHQTTLLAMAFWLTGEDRYARAAVAQIESWIAANPFLHGIHWASGIEVGMRLIAFVWTRRLLEAWPAVRQHFEHNARFVESVFLHQWLLAHRRSYGSSANNHLLYEMAGLFVSASAMPWFAQSEAWRTKARVALEEQFPRQVFASGYTRELASDYDGFVFEALILALVEGDLSGAPFAAPLWQLAACMGSCLAEIVDCLGQPPRQGDSDDASGLLLDAPGYDRWADLLRLSRAWFSSEAVEPQSLRAWLLTPLAQPRVSSDVARMSVARDAGLVILRAAGGTPQEIYCAFDAGPLGFLSIAAHGHADALAVELRYGGRPVLVDPGTYLYAGPWRDYFRGTAAHNTLELGHLSQSLSGGPFLWARHARTTLLSAGGSDDNAPRAVVAACHDGYESAPFHGRHCRHVALDRAMKELAIRDEVSVARPTALRLFFHLHPDIICTVEGASAVLSGNGATIRMALPKALDWRAVRGSEVPMLGWYSPAYGVKVATTTLVGEALLDSRGVYETRLQFPTL